ncbi:MAG: PD-(D/E)XK nuclease family protein [Leptolyngbyaceae cyanobacterium MO_188.B28]|nr:PD-(D/E)XK nuclease family protein [Leptolyngbyaceae cyanobacterium MO_188.B28]
MSLSQGQLTLLSTCPRKFQHTYLDQLGALTKPEQQERLLWGSRFHLLMQQRELGLPIDRLADQDPQFQESLTGLVTAEPTVFEPAIQSDGAFRQSEHRRTVEFRGYLLTVIFDLLILTAAAGRIFDWKTHPQPRDRGALAKDWQTRLYLYVLTETTDLAPEQVSMTYWFVRRRDSQTGKLVPQSLRFDYNQALHDQSRQDLIGLTDQLTAWRLGRVPLPQVEASKGLCLTCPFAVRCQRADDGPDFNPSVFPDLADVQEVIL